MTAEEIYTERLTNTDTIALATLNLEGNAPRVRTVNMVYLPETPNTIYFTSNGQSAKTKEFLVHDTVSFITDDIDHLAVRVNEGHVTRADNSDEVFAALDAKYEHIRNFTSEFRSKLVIFKITFDEAVVITRKGETTLAF